ncbi:MAG: hypothetical protein NZ555_09195 [Geminicoccaceae bacterium]|nr:hypothetical protein [Geminicoccaceae bacterium]MDW8370194.1 hypothetical protein [Geminicoccaceae bacterium]
MSGDTNFVPLTSAFRPVRSSRARGSELGHKADLPLVDLAAPAEPTSPAAATVAVVSSADDVGARALRFSEAELARACAGVAAQQRSIAEAAAAERVARASRSIETRLLEALGELQRDRTAERALLLSTAREVLTAVLQALLPKLREERLADGLARLLEASLPGLAPAHTLLVELPAAELETAAARLPSLLAAVGWEGGFEIRPISGSEDLLRLRCGDSWAELDLEAWARGLSEQLRELLAVPSASQSNQGA